MLRKLISTSDSPFQPGCEIFLVTRSGEVLEGFRIASILCELVSLDRPPLAESPKQGFTIDGTLLKPNWCAGRRELVAGTLTRAEAEILAAKRRRRP